MITGGLTSIDGVEHYRIDGVEEMSPFLTTVVSDSDLWMFVSSTGALPEVVGGFGIECDPLRASSIARALVRATQDHRHRSLIRRAGPRFAARHDWEVVGEHYLEVFGRLECEPAAGDSE